MERRKIAFTLTKQMIQDYASASGDLNPIHLDDTFATTKGLPSSISHGMLVMGLCASKLMEVWNVPEFSTYEMNFLSYVLPGETLILTSSIDEEQGTGTLSTQNGQCKAEFKFT